MPRYAALVVVVGGALASAAVFAGGQSPRSEERAAVARSIDLPVADVSAAGLADAIARARQQLAERPGTRVVLQLPAGTFDLSGPRAGRRPASIDLSGIDACPAGLVLRGAGMMRTTLIKDDDLVGIIARNASCLTITDLTLAQKRPEVSQGTVTAVAPGTIDIDVPAGFASPAALAAVTPSRDYNGRAIRWAKRFERVGSDVRMIVNERAVRWTGAVPVPGKPLRFRITIDVGRPGATQFKMGDLVGLTAKSGGQAYRFVNGHDITFQNVRWIGDARGKFRRVDRVTIRGVRVTPPAQIAGMPYLFATSAGGPQIGHPGDPLTTGHVVEDNVFEKTGDDAIALADASGVVRRNRITDAARGILIVGAGDVTLADNILVRAPVLHKAVGGAARPRRACAADEDCRPRRAPPAGDSDDDDGF
ncbi:hypothetical protein [Sphingomonas sp. TZW2008]|uniref:hypothetical protein n=1 Tax=Sphingomonas sp. TZW2008 TaxID=1917973 RepID=UPI000A27031F|nr:hypothetical protein [Sphingomonas sp. TZW2008]